MNENLNLVEMLKDCPMGTKLYSTVFGEVEFEGINDIVGPIIVETKTGNAEYFTIDGKMFENYDGECVLFPDREQRDWSKFKVKKPKFDPKTLQPFERVLVRDGNIWCCEFFSHIDEKEERYPYYCTASFYEFVIPYNEDTKHLLGTAEEAPEYYRYWED